MVSHYKEAVRSDAQYANELLDQLKKLKSKVELALFIMKDNEWHHEESAIEHQVYMILENALKEVEK